MPLKLEAVGFGFARGAGALCRGDALYADDGITHEA
jgi:hypothetical protein